MMVAIVTKSRHLGLLCDLDISDCLLACTVIFIRVSLLHDILLYTKPKGNKLRPSPGASDSGLSERFKNLFDLTLFVI
jgi:hypothetical protein